MAVALRENLGASSGVEVRGLDELNKALRRTSKEVRLGIRAELRQVAEPIRSDAERLARSEIPRISLGRRKWWKMRTGLALANNVIYVAPSQRGVKARGRGGSKRPNLADLLSGRAMEPALDLHKHEIESEIDRMMQSVCNRFSLEGVAIG